MFGQPQCAESGALGSRRRRPPPAVRLRAPSRRSPADAAGSVWPASSATANGGSWSRPGARQTVSRSAAVACTVDRRSCAISCGRVHVELRLHALRRQDRDRRQRACRKRADGCRPRRIREDDDGGERGEHGGRRRRARAADRSRRAGGAAPARRGRRSRAIRAAPPCSRTRSSSARSAPTASSPSDDRIDEPARWRPRRRLRVGDHEEEEDEHLGRGDEHPPEVEARDRAEVPARGHRVAREREHADPGRERQPRSPARPAAASAARGS